MRDDEEAAPVPKNPEQISVGEILRRTREARQLSLAQVSEELRLEPQALTALEEDRFDALGAPVFIKGYLRNYADCLDLDAGKVLELYRSQHGDEEPDVRARHSLESEPERPVGTWAVAALAVVLIGGFLWFRYPAGDDGAESSAVAEGASSGAAPADASPASGAPRSQGDSVPAGASTPVGASTSVGASTPVGASTSARASADGDASAEAAGNVPGEAAGDGSAGPAASAEGGVFAEGAASAGGEVSAGAAASADGGASAEPAVTAALESRTIAAGQTAAGDLEIELQFIEDSWTEITDAADQRLYYGLGRAGAEVSFSASPPVSVLFGNADGVAMRVDGEAFSYPAGSRSGNLAVFTLPAE